VPGAESHASRVPSIGASTENRNRKRWKLFEERRHALERGLLLREGLGPHSGFYHAGGRVKHYRKVGEVAGDKQTHAQGEAAIKNHACNGSESDPDGKKEDDRTRGRSPYQGRVAEKLSGRMPSAVVCV